MKKMNLFKKAAVCLSAGVMLSAAVSATAAPAAYSLPGSFTVSPFTTFGATNLSVCVHTMLTYLAGGSPSHADINAGLSSMTIPSYLNAHQRRHRYVQAVNPTIADFKHMVWYDIVTCQVPTLIRISGSGIARWYYSPTGNGIMTTGITADKSRVKIADPMGYVAAGCPVYYSKPTDVVQSYTHWICY